MSNLSSLVWPTPHQATEEVHGKSLEHQEPKATSETIPSSSLGAMES